MEDFILPIGTALSGSSQIRLLTVLESCPGELLQHRDLKAAANALGLRELAAAR